MVSRCYSSDHDGGRLETARVDRDGLAGRLQPQSGRAGERRRPRGGYGRRGVGRGCERDRRNRRRRGSDRSLLGNVGPDGEPHAGLYRREPIHKGRARVGLGHPRRHLRSESVGGGGRVRPVPEHQWNSGGSRRQRDLPRQSHRWQSSHGHLLAANSWCRWAVGVGSGKDHGGCAIRGGHLRGHVFHCSGSIERLGWPRSLTRATLSRITARRLKQ